MTEKWFKCVKKPVMVLFREPHSREERIYTREGVLSAYKGKDYVIKGVEGELYPIAKHIFKKTYEVCDANWRQKNEVLRHSKECGFHR